MVSLAMNLLKTEGHKTFITNQPAAMNLHSKNIKHVSHLHTPPHPFNLQNVIKNQISLTILYNISVILIYSLLLIWQLYYEMRGGENENTNLLKDEEANVN